MKELMSAGVDFPAFSAARKMLVASKDCVEYRPDGLPMTAWYLVSKLAGAGPAGAVRTAPFGGGRDRRP